MLVLHILTNCFLSHLCGSEGLQGLGSTACGQLWAVYNETVHIIKSDVSVTGAEELHLCHMSTCNA